MKNNNQSHLQSLLFELANIEDYEKECIEVENIQFLKEGRKRRTTTFLPKRLLTKYEELKRCGARFTSEILNTGEVSICIEKPEISDYDILIVPNGPEIQAAMIDLLERFDVEKFTNWEAGDFE